MVEKIIKTRVQQKHDFEVNWIKAINFIPLEGEIIFYDAEVDCNGNVLTTEYPEGRTQPIDYIRIKVGNGINTINELPFELTSTSAQANWDQNNPEAADYIKNKPTILSEEELIIWLNEESIVEPITSELGEIYIANNNEIYTL